MTPEEDIYPAVPADTQVRYIRGPADIPLAEAEGSFRGLINLKTQYFVLREKAVPEVLLKVVEAKRLLETKKVETVQEASDMVGISRSSFYKYKDDIFPFHENSRGKTVNFIIQMKDATDRCTESCC